MTILDKLHFIEKHKTIYNIHYCRAGVGFIFFYPDPYKNDSCKTYNFPEDWTKQLRVEKYYPTFEKAVEAEYQRIKEP
ncbi:hypothetical protein ES705_09352 [subsurface metagenome]